MNKKDILSTDFLDMEAGKELDALIAENIMGIEILRNPKSAICGGCKVSQGIWAVKEKNYHEWGDNVEFPHPYSSDISAMWEVIEKLSELNHGDLSLTLFQRKSFAPQWRCGLTWKGDIPVSTWEDSAPLAVCRAALKAIVIKG